MHKRIPILVALLLVAGCSARPAPASGIILTAELTTPVDVELTWAGEVAGTTVQSVEFATEPAGPWTVIQFLPADQRTFAHPDLIPQTRLYYRIRPLLGPASAPVPVHLAAPDSDVPTGESDQSWANPRTLPGGGAAARSLRDAGAAAAPGALTATVMARDAIRFTWADNAADEDGQLLEVRPDGADGWSVAMALDPNVNSIGLMALPTERDAVFRVRAFYYGPSSDVAHRTTGRSPED